MQSHWKRYYGQIKKYFTVKSENVLWSHRKNVLLSNQKLYNGQIEKWVNS